MLAKMLGKNPVHFRTAVYEAVQMRALLHRESRLQHMICEFFDVGSESAISKTWFARK
jgi:hypothetical protein